MFIQKISLSNFRCFGPTPTTITLSPEITAFVGTNGAGKTALMHALLRLFGVSAEQRRIRRQDFHVPLKEESPVEQRFLWIEAILAFPELRTDDSASADAKPVDKIAVPDFFDQMAATRDGELKCRFRLEATWIDDGSIEGIVEYHIFAIKSMQEAFDETLRIELKAVDRTRIQMIYVPAMRDASSQVISLLRSRLWRAIDWSTEMREIHDRTSKELDTATNNERAVVSLTHALGKRWQELHTAATDADPRIKTLDTHFEHFVRKFEIVLLSDEHGRERSLDNLSDGQRSLFHIAMTAAALDVESKVLENKDNIGYDGEKIAFPALTLICLEEPENSVAPFYLSRILVQLQRLTQGTRTQALVSSHSSSILSRIEPEYIRYFRFDNTKRIAQVQQLSLPAGVHEANKYLREAIRSYPELYFSRFVVLGEGDSEQTVLPRFAKASGLPLDQSFVAIVPLGGRHVNHMWRLLDNLGIPYITLLDLDYGRTTGGWQRIKEICENLIESGKSPQEVLRKDAPVTDNTSALTELVDSDGQDTIKLHDWCLYLRKFGVYFSELIDLDMMMLVNYPNAYQKLGHGEVGPYEKDSDMRAVLGKKGHLDYYPDECKSYFGWYRYNFLDTRRSKPASHLRALSSLSDEDLLAEIPEPITAILGRIARELRLEPVATQA